MKWSWRSGACQGIALGWSLTTQGVAEQAIPVLPLANEDATNCAFYALGAEDITHSGSKLRYINWITGKA